MMKHKIDYSETKYKSVSGLTTDTAGGITVPNGEVVSITRFRANGADPSIYVVLCWDYDGAAEKIFASTKGDIDLLLDPASPENQVTGDGTKKIQIVIINDTSTQSAIVGGSVEVTKLG